jgi:hypothetical protein
MPVRVWSNTLSHYARTKQLSPALVLQSGSQKWDVADLR